MLGGRGSIGQMFAGQGVFFGHFWGDRGWNYILEQNCVKDLWTTRCMATVCRLLLSSVFNYAVLGESLESGVLHLANRPWGQNAIGKPHRQQWHFQENPLWPPCPSNESKPHLQWYRSFQSNIICILMLT